MKTSVKKYFFPIFLSILLFIVLGFEIYLLRLPPEQIPTRFIIISLFVLNIIALLTLAFFVIRSIFRLYLEKNREVPGYRFRIKIVTIFVGLVIIPSTLLFIAFSGVLENSIEKIFSKHNRKVINDAVETIKLFYDFEKNRLLGILEEYKKGEIKKLPQNISIEIITKYNENTPQVYKEAFEGKKSAQIITSEEGDLVVSAMPYEKGIIVAKTYIPNNISKKVEELKTYHEDYLKMGTLRRAVKTNYLMFLAFLSLIIIFLALWTALKISQEITEPLKELVQATEKIKSGEFKTKVLSKSSDEIGILVNSFNEMVEKLDKAYSEISDRNFLLERILSNITSGVIFVSPDGIILTINRAGEEILQIPNEQIENKHYQYLIDRIESEDLRNFINKITTERISDISKDLVIRIKETNKRIRARIISLRESQSNVSTGILVVFDDITDIVKAQQAIAWEEVTRRLAHEIKNPLTPIKLATERLIKKWKNKDEDFDRVFEKSTHTIITEVESLKSLIDAFQKLGKLPEIKKIHINPLNLIEDVIELYKGYRDIKIKIETHNEIRDILLDPQEFKRVLINIFDNAIKAMNGKGEINVSVKLDSKLIIEISDTGPGVDDETKEKLFLPYFSKSKDGTGLGLAIARKIVTEHGGKISVYDNEPKGTTFKIEVPL